MGRFMSAISAEHTSVVQMSPIASPDGRSGNRAAAFGLDSARKRVAGVLSRTGATLPFAELMHIYDQSIVFKWVSDMRFPLNRLWSGLVFAALAGAALAHSGVQNPHVLLRMNAMTSSADAVGLLAKMAKGEIAFDASAAAQARADIILNTRSIPDSFRDPHHDPKTEALPVIWENWADFEKKNQKSLQAIEALNVSDLAQLRQGLPAVGGACLACHQIYRKKKH